MVSWNVLIINHFKIGLVHWQTTFLEKVDTYFDDVVADNSWAQIFIGDKPQFDDCSQLELQQVVDWQVGENGEDDVAQFQLRYGSLPKNTPLYIYILNENGLFTGVGFKIFSNEPQ